MVKITIKKDVIVQCRKFFVNVDALVRIMLKQITNVCRLQKIWKASRNLKKQVIYFCCFFLRPVHLVLRLPNATRGAKEKGSFIDELNLRITEWNINCCFTLDEFLMNIPYLVYFLWKMVWSTLGIMRSSLDQFLSKFPLTYSHWGYFIGFFYACETFFH